MRVLLSFAPFIAFALLLGTMPLVGACVVAACIGAALLLRDRLVRGRPIKILEAGSVLLYAGLALLAALLPAPPPMWAVWAVNDAGLLLIALVSLGIGLPFTLQYAREEVAPELWDNPVFLMVNRRITAVWAAAFAAMLLGELAVAAMPRSADTASTVVSIVALVAALRFTRWYPAHVRQAATAARSSA